MSPSLTRGPHDPLASSRLALGTAQLSEPYGIVSAVCKEPFLGHAQAKAVLDAAQELRLTAVDTAPAYGRAEALIGSSSWRGPVWTKLSTTTSILESVERSLTALQRTRLDVLFIHDMRHLRSFARRERTQLQALLGNTVAALGISAYETEDVFEAHESVGISVVQAPVNVFDTRFETAFSEGKLPETLRYVARSALLQGALADPTTAAERLRGPLAERLIWWSKACAALSVPPGEAALAWALSREFVESVIVGAEDAGQLGEIATWSRSQRASEILSAIRAHNLWPLSDPRQWCQ